MLLNTVQPRLCSSNASKLVDYISMQANELVAQRCASHCQSTELHKDLVVVAVLTPEDGPSIT